MPNPVTNAELGPSQQPLRDGSPLCVECGLCCQGVLHHYANLEEEEVEAAIARGLGVERDRDYLGFALPCAKLDGTRCTIYEQRPSTCSGYQCGLLKRYRSGDVPLDEAISLVAKARQLFEAVMRTVPPSTTFREVREKWRLRSRRGVQDAIGGGDQQQPGQTFVRIVMLDLFLDRHIRLEREKSFMGEEDAATAPPPAEPIDRRAV